MSQEVVSLMINIVVEIPNFRQYTCLTTSFSFYYSFTPWGSFIQLFFLSVFLCRSIESGKSLIVKSSNYNTHFLSTSSYKIGKKSGSVIWTVLHSFTNSLNKENENQMSKWGVHEKLVNPKKKRKNNNTLCIHCRLFSTWCKDMKSLKFVIIQFKYDFFSSPSKRYWTTKPRNLNLFDFVNPVFISYQ